MAATGGVVNTTIVEPVQILYRGHNKALYDLLTAGTTIAVTPNGGLDGTIANLATNRPLGVLSGMVARPVAVTGSLFGCTWAAQTHTPIGIFLLGYESPGYENNPGVASGKVSIISGPAVLKVYIFETINSDGSTALTYTLGGALFASNNGLLTSQEEAGAGSGSVVGYCVHVPTTAEDWVGIELSSRL